ncbi:MAG TPA: MarR family transcriptional regulator [Stellaceae bacterium]|jgi:DNA-binding MarR family transcriptional regulator|nr:MarR family transcriptional regulator [Stellaceae bacterium]
MMIDSRVYDGLADIRSALRRFLAISDAATGAAEITPQQYQALLALKVHTPEGLIIRDLAREMGLQHNAMVQLVVRLVQAGLVDRCPSPKDGRSVVVLLTSKGEELLDQITGDHFQTLLDNGQLLAETLYRLKQLERFRKGKVRLG